MMNNPEYADFNTRTMAKVYEAQGHLNEAAQIYRNLLKQEPERMDYTEALDAVELKISMRIPAVNISTPEDNIDSKPPESKEESMIDIVDEHVVEQAGEKINTKVDEEKPQESLLKQWVDLTLRYGRMKKLKRMQ